MKSSMTRQKPIATKRHRSIESSTYPPLSGNPSQAAIHKKSSSRNGTMLLNPIRGFTLIETVIFIVVLGIIGVSILAAFVAALQFSPNTKYASRATELAQQRMDVILGQKYLFGFAGTQDPCIATPGLPVCAIPAGYTVSSAIANNWLGDVNYKVVTVTVGGLSQLTLTSLVANY